MNYRTSSFSIGNQALKYSAQYRASIQKYQQQISSGIRLNRPSDDPISFRQVSSLNVRLQELKTESHTIMDSEAKLNTSVSQLQAANALVVRAKNLAQQGIQATSEGEQTAFATEVEGLLASLQEISKIKASGSYLYSGAKSTQQPFTFRDPQVAGGTLQVDYLGSAGNSRAYIGDSISIDTNFAGNRIFGDPARGETLIQGNTGAKLGYGTDSIVGRATLQVQHSTTTYSGASGIVAGASSVDGDTVIGPAGSNALVLQDTSGTGDSGTIALNGGAQVAWTRGNTDLQVTDEYGRVVHVNLSAVALGFNGTVDFASGGTLSVDGGRTEVAIDFSESQTITDSITGKQVHIDTREVNRSGDEFLEFTNTSDVFQVLYELKEDLRNTRGFNNDSRTAALDRRIGELDRMSSHLLEAVGQQSASLQVLDELDFRVQDLQLEVETQVSGIQSTNIPDAVLRMQNDQSLLEYTYAVTAQISSTSLIDFLR